MQVETKEFLMVKKAAQDETNALLKEIIHGIQEKKGLEISCMHLGKINSSVCDYFVVCHGTSNTHVGAIADSIEEQVQKNLGIKARRKEGLQNAEWILIDFIDIVVHVFQEEVRRFYRLEDLWADAPLEHIKE